MFILLTLDINNSLQKGWIKRLKPIKIKTNRNIFHQFRFLWFYNPIGLGTENNICANKKVHLLQVLIAKLIRSGGNNFSSA